MEQKTKTLEELSSEVINYLRRLSYSDSRISQYRSALQRLDKYMKENLINYYSPVVGESFIAEFIGTKQYEILDRWEKDIIRCVNILTEFQATSSVPYRRIQKAREFEGDIGKTMTAFLDYRKSLDFSKNSLDHIRLNLHRFMNYLNENNISEIKLLQRQHILSFINQLVFYTPNSRHGMLCTLRAYFRFLHDGGDMEVDYSFLVPKDNYKKECKLPTTYSSGEVNELILAVDRSSPKGKRDVAMILLAARLGLRASDICNLKFENLLWEQNMIFLIQQKTRKRIELPILDEIGNTIIDYLKYGRPKSDLPYVFLHVIPPYNALNRTTLHSIVTFYLRRAGIQHVDEKKHGPHALRHSLAGILLEQKTPLPVISEVLGHSNTESTKTYLRVDMTSLRQCALEVPPLSTVVYNGEVR